jgi:hypothetical protein
MRRRAQTQRDLEKVSKKGKIEALRKARARVQSKNLVKALKSKKDLEKLKNDLEPYPNVWRRMLSTERPSHGRPRKAPVCCDEALYRCCCI